MTAAPGCHPPQELGKQMRYRLEVRLTIADVGKRVVLRWRRPAAQGGEEVADVVGMLEAASSRSFTVRRASGDLIVIPRERALAGKVVPPRPVRPTSRHGVHKESTRDPEHHDLRKPAPRC
jgi:hypothetical protein